jgi:hypothetical protein
MFPPFWLTAVEVNAVAASAFGDGHQHEYPGYGSGEARDGGG